MKEIFPIGLGYLGLPAAEFAKIGPVTGFEIHQTRISELQQGLDRTRECSQAQLRAAQQLIFTSKEDDIQDSEIFIVTVPSPVGQAKPPDANMLIMASQMIGSHLKVRDIVIYESVVYPGAIEDICVPIVEKASGLTFNFDFYCGYSPERINLDDKQDTITTIKKITSGSTPEIADQIDALYSRIIIAGTWQKSSIKVAEAAKIIENSQRDLNITFVNELSVIFDRASIDTGEVLEATGSKWSFMPFRPLMVGGHYIGALTHKAEKLGYSPQVIMDGGRIND